MGILNFWHSYIISHWMHATFLGETYWKHGGEGEEEEWYVDTYPLWHCGWLLLLWFKYFAELELMGLETDSDPVCDTWTHGWQTALSILPKFLEYNERGMSPVCVVWWRVSKNVHKHSVNDVLYYCVATSDILQHSWWCVREGAQLLVAIPLWQFLQVTFFNKINTYICMYILIILGNRVGVRAVEILQLWLQPVATTGNGPCGWGCTWATPTWSGACRRGSIATSLSTST